VIGGHGVLRRAIDETTSLRAQLQAAEAQLQGQAWEMEVQLGADGIAAPPPSGVMSLEQAQTVPGALLLLCSRSVRASSRLW
jgi:hypothetical protein